MSHRGVRTDRIGPSRTTTEPTRRTPMTPSNTHALDSSLGSSPGVRGGQLPSGNFTTGPPSEPTPGPADAPLFLGLLSIITGRRGSWLCITHRCPHCRGPHNHTWTLNAPTPTHRTAHCWRLPSPFEFPRGYWVFPLMNSPDTERVLARYRELVESERTGSRPRRKAVSVSGKTSSFLTFDGWLIKDD